MFDLARTAGVLGALDADVIGLQEVDVHWAARSGFADEARQLAHRLGMRVFFAPIYDLDPAQASAPRRQYGVAVLSRYPVLSAENHEITRLSTLTPDPVPSPAPGFAEVTVNVRGALVHFYCTHLDCRADPSVRDPGPRHARRPGRRSRPEDPGGRLQRGDGRPRARGIVDPAAGRRTADDATYPAAAPGRPHRPDHRLACDRSPLTSTEPTLASDHRPVVADVRLPRS